MSDLLSMTNKEIEALTLSPSQKVIRKLIDEGQKDCSWCERHLHCKFERGHYRPGFYCTAWTLSHALRKELYPEACG